MGAAHTPRARGLLAPRAAKARRMAVLPRVFARACRRLASVLCLSERDAHALLFREFLRSPPLSLRAASACMCQMTDVSLRVRSCRVQSLVSFACALGGLGASASCACSLCYYTRVIPYTSRIPSSDDRELHDETPGTVCLSRDHQYSESSISLTSHVGVPTMVPTLVQL